MKKSDTEQEQPGLEENKVPDSQSKRELDRELQELAEKEHQEEIYYEERRRERHERNLKRKKRQIRNRNLALIITALAVLGGVGYFYREQTGLKDGMETLVAKVRDLVPDKNSGKESKAAEELAKADQSTENPESIVEGGDVPNTRVVLEVEFKNSGKKDGGNFNYISSWVIGKPNKNAFYRTDSELWEHRETKLAGTMYTGVGIKGGTTYTTYLPFYMLDDSPEFFKPNSATGSEYAVIKEKEFYYLVATKPQRMVVDIHV